MVEKLRFLRRTASRKGGDGVSGSEEMLRDEVTQARASPPAEGAETALKETDELRAEVTQARASPPKEGMESGPGDGDALPAEAAVDGPVPTEEQQQSVPKKKKPNTMKALIRLVIKLVIAGAAAWAILTYVVGVFVVHSNDMYPAVRDGDLLITYRIRPPVRGEIVAYTARGERRFGRVSGMEGDVIEIDEEGHFTINGGIPYETIYYVTASDPDSGVSYPFTVPPGTVFVLNDLRDNTGDSRRFGAIPITETDGSAALLLRRRGW